MSLASEVLALAKINNARIVTAESCTGGLVAAALTDVPGSSATFLGGIVSYSNELKISGLRVQKDTLETYGAVSEPVAREMAAGALQAIPDASFSVAITGIAGPGGSEFKPEGRVCFAIATPEQAPVARTVEFGALGRQQVRNAATQMALTLLAEALRNQ